MSETASRQTFLKHLKEWDPTSHAQRFEDKYHSGIPDMNVAIMSGEWWIEAKHLDNWPVRPETLVRVPFRRGQVLWLNARSKAGGRCLVLMRIGSKDWAVWSGHFDELEEGLPKDRLLALAKWHGRTLDLDKIFHSEYMNA